MATAWIKKPLFDPAAFDEIERILVKAQSLEIQAAEKILGGQGEILRKKVADIDNKYKVLLESLRAGREKLTRTETVEELRADLEAREAKLKSERAETERIRMEWERRRKEQDAREAEITKKATEVNAVERAPEILRKEQELHAELEGFRQESEAIRRIRGELGKEAEDLERKREELETRSRQLEEEKEGYRRKVEEAVLAAFQSALVGLVRDRLQFPP